MLIGLFDSNVGKELIDGTNDSVIVDEGTVEGATEGAMDAINNIISKNLTESVKLR